MMTPQLTLQYGQVLRVSLAREIFRLWVCAWTGVRSNPSVDRPAPPTTAPLRKVLRENSIETSSIHCVLWADPGRLYGPLRRLRRLKVAVNASPTRRHDRRNWRTDAAQYRPGAEQESIGDYMDRKSCRCRGTHLLFSRNDEIVVAASHRASR